MVIWSVPHTPLARLTSIVSLLIGVAKNRTTASAPPIERCNTVIMRIRCQNLTLILVPGNPICLGKSRPDRIVAGLFTPSTETCKRVGCKDEGDDCSGHDGSCFHGSSSSSGRSITHSSSSSTGGGEQEQA